MITTPDLTAGQPFNVNDWKTHLIDPEKKDAVWGKNIFEVNKPNLRTAFASSGFIGTYSLDFEMIRQYANGNQPEAIYKVQFDPQDKQAKYTGLNWGIAPIIPTLRSRVLKEMASVPQDVLCEAIDPIANSKKNMDKLRLKAEPIVNKQLKKFALKMGLQTPMKANYSKKILNTPFDSSTEFESDEEIDLLMSKEAGYYNFNVEMANELAIKSILEYNNFSEISLLLDKDAFDYGMCAYRTYMNVTDGMPTFQYLRPDKIHVGGSKYADYSDVNMWYYPVPATLADVKDYFGDDLTEEDAKAIWEQSAKRRPSDISTYPIGYTSDWRHWNYGDLMKIEVDMFYFEVKTQDVLTYEESITKTGGKKLKKKPFDYTPPKDGEKKSKKNFWAEVWYKGYYITGLSRVYGWDKISNMQREKGKEQFCKPTLNIRKFQEKGWTEYMITWADMFQLNYLKLQHEVLKAKPKGYFFNWDAISQPFIGSDGTISAVDMIKMFEQTGSGLYHSMGEDGEPLMANANAPHMPAENGISANAKQYAEYMAFAYNQMAECIGMSPTAEAVNPSERLGLGVQQNAMATSSNARFLLIDGKQKMMVANAKYVSYCLQDIAKHNPITWEKIKAMVGVYNTTIIESMDDIPLHAFGIYPKDVPSEEQKNFVNQIVMQAYNKPIPEIDIEDVFNIIYMKNYKLAIQLFNMKRKKKQRELNKQQQQAMEMQMQQMQMQMQHNAQLETSLKQIPASASIEVAKIQSQVALLIAKMEEQSDTQKKLISEINKANIKDREMANERFLQQNEPPKKVA